MHLSGVRDDMEPPMWKLPTFSTAMLLFLFSGLLVVPRPARADDAVRLFQENVVCEAIPCRKSDHAIVFIHGLTGSGETWRNQNGAYWPDLIGRDGDLAAYDVFRIDYDSYKVSVSPDVDALDDGVYEKLRLLSGYHSITFIAHSLGGLIVQRYLQTVNLRETHLGLNRFRFAVFLGTPSEGANLASMASWLSANPTLRILNSSAANDYSKLLTKQMWFTMQKHEGTGCRSLRIFAGIETKETFGVTVVTPDSAERGAYACRKLPYNHIDISKPESADDERYKGVKSLLVKCLAQDAGVCPRAVSLEQCGRSQAPIEGTPAMRCDHGQW
jgi:pimeloyl-ACP methyl ester carboxylesterase